LLTNKLPDFIDQFAKLVLVGNHRFLQSLCA
jgi:hypothetical protein